MTLLLLRHADAGDRAAWTGDDRQRPLSAPGRRQSEALIEVHARRPLERVISSPARRCLDTVAPLAMARGIDVEEDQALAEGAPFALVHGLLRRCSGQDVLLCSHGDVVGAIVRELERRHLLPVSAGWPKASTWLADTWPDTGHVEFVAPPNVS